MLSPWTLPGGLPATSSNGLRPMSRRMSWLAASDIASPTSAGRSEEHTSELQSPCNLVCRLLLEKKKTRRPETARRSPGAPERFTSHIAQPPLGSPCHRGSYSISHSLRHRHHLEARFLARTPYHY